MVLIGVINEYKNGTYDDMDGIEILNSFGIECRHIFASNEDSCSYNKADMLSDYIKENIFTVFPKAKDYKNVPHYNSAYLIRDISFRLDRKEE